jgi:hypothetical protein
VGGYGLVSSGSEQRPLVSSCEHGNTTYGPIKDGELLEQLRDCQLLKVSAQYSI